MGSWGLRHTLLNRMPYRAVSRKLPKGKKKGRSRRKVVTGPSPSCHYSYFFSMTISVLAPSKVAPAGTIQKAAFLPPSIPVRSSMRLPSMPFSFTR